MDDKTSRRLSRAKYARESSEWTEGDFEVITSDRVRYLVPSYHLFGASKLFRDAQVYESASNWPVKYSVAMPDPELESSAVFDLFLDLVVHVPLHGLLAPVRGAMFPDWLCVCGLFKFMHKWGCPESFRKILMHNIHQELLNPDTALEYYVIGAIIGDADMCRTVLQNHAQNRLAAFAPNKCPYFLWRVCPPAYVGALTRVWAEAQKSDQCSIATRFNLHLSDLTFSEAQLIHHFSGPKKEAEAEEAGRGC